MSEVESILAEIDIELLGDVSEEQSAVLHRCKTLLSTNVVIDKETATKIFHSAHKNYLFPKDGPELNSLVWRKPWQVVAGELTRISTTQEP
ncbi:MAG: hypothetical protein COA78_25145 [Blastopirellula sp.]|nr:MAG: hypothetical protein COA78_25145 [Blastopirellula sp.]